MTDFILAAITLVWLLGSGVRIYRQARFFQIEEYMGARYLRWALSRHTRLLPPRTIIGWVAGAALTAMLAEAPGSLLPALIGLAASGIAVAPPRQREVKKPFRQTGRAMRMLVTALILAAVVLVAVGAAALTTFGDESVVIRTLIIMAAGLLVFLLAPLVLLAANMSMRPVEALTKQLYLSQAREALDEIQPIVIGITGSYGKTSTKTFLAQILGGCYRVLPTPRSYNTLMGVCRAINETLANDYSTEYFVAEMGAYVEGEIEEICALTRPRIGIVVDVGPQHLERFGSLENTARAKYELIQALPADGVGIFNWDSPVVREMYERGYPATRLAVSRQVMPGVAASDGPRLIASNIRETLDGLRFTVTDMATGDSIEFVTGLLGEHNVTNILLATAVAVHEKMSLRDVARMVRLLQPAENRLVRQETAQGITIINDAYSSNPVGAASALRVLGMYNGGRRLLITPGMVELGERMEAENRRLGELAAQYASDVILVGSRHTAPIKDGLLAAGFAEDRIHVVDTLAESIAWYRKTLRAGDTVLFLNDLPDTYHA